MTLTKQEQGLLRFCQSQCVDISAITRTDTEAHQKATNVARMLDEMLADSRRTP